MEFELKKRYNDDELASFAEKIIAISDQIGFKVSSRGWCYILEGERLINKDEFDKVDALINNCRRKGFLPIDFVAEEKSREFTGIEEPTEGTVIAMFGRHLNGAMNTHEYYTPDWWEGEEYYIQMVVEKIDLVTLFSPVCEEYHIPIANSKGWSSMLQRAEYARRFREAEEMGLQPVLLYCGDHDPDGLRISQFIKDNLIDLQYVQWEDGTRGFNPDDLIIERFGLNYDFIVQNNLTWIDNLITGSGKNLASPAHKNHHMPYVKEYLKKIGARKCEANAIVTQPQAARDLVREAIEGFLGADARQRFQDKRDAVEVEFNKFLDKNDVRTAINKIQDAIRKYKK
jgi:hypothetical protein